MTEHGNSEQILDRSVPLKTAHPLFVEKAGGHIGLPLCVLPLSDSLSPLGSKALPSLHRQ